MLQELDELGLLEHVTALSSVSGSSLTAAYYGLFRNDGERCENRTMGIVEAAGADVAGIAVVVHLADPRAVIAVVLEQLRQGDGIGQKFSEVRRRFVVRGKLSRPWIGTNLGHVGSASRQEGTATWTAEWELAVRPFEQNTPRSQLVNVG